MSKEAAMKKLIQACQENPELLTRLIEKPQDIAKEHGVTLEPEELQQLDRVKRLKGLVEEFKAGRVLPPHIGYPVDVLWKTTLANHILFYRPIFYPVFYSVFPHGPIFYRRPVFYHVFYPIGYYFRAGGMVEVDPQFRALRSLGEKKRSR